LTQNPKVLGLSFTKKKHPFTIKIDQKFIFHIYENHIQKNGLGWAARLLTRASTTPFDEAGIKESLERWARKPAFTYMVGDPSSSGGAALVSGVRDLATLDVLGNDFGWGKLVAVRSEPGNKADGKVTVFEGPKRGGSISLQVCIAPNALARLVADEEFMAAGVSVFYSIGFSYICNVE
jgi:hypothetical protein